LNPIETLDCLGSKEDLLIVVVPSSRQTYEGSGLGLLERKGRDEKFIQSNNLKLGLGLSLGKGCMGSIHVTDYIITNKLIQCVNWDQIQ
jgi:hypothetical protein